MKIATTYKDGEIFQHFGHSEQFKIYEISNGEITSEKVFDAVGSGHGALAGFLVGYGVNVLICGGIGSGAQSALKNAGIAVFGGVEGSANDAVNALLNGSLRYNPEVKCDHHDHEDHGGHDCSAGGCGGCTHCKH